MALTTMSSELTPQPQPVRTGSSPWMLLGFVLGLLAMSPILYFWLITPVAALMLAGLLGLVGIAVRRVLPLAEGALAAAAFAAVVVVIMLVGMQIPYWKFMSAQSCAPHQQPQVVLPFTGLDLPEGVAVDSTGNVYVTDSNHARVLKLGAGATTQAVLPFTGLSLPNGVAVDSAGDVYVLAAGLYGANYRVLKLAAGGTTPAELPFTGLKAPEGMAVDSAGNV
jgi:serine/threonine protein kinase, bacterial